MHVAGDILWAMQAAGNREAPATELIVVRPGDAPVPDAEAPVIRLLVLDEADDPGLHATSADMVMAPVGSRAATHRSVVGVDDVDAATESLVRAVADHPVASWSLARLVVVTSGLDVSSGLVAESATYSTLLAGSEFGAWLAARAAPRPADGADRVSLAREGDELVITLTRPHRRNAYDASMRDAVLEALDVARWDPSLRVRLMGEGPVYCAGGDLDEFGAVADVAAAHMVRVSAHPGAAIARMRDRVTVHVHGWAVGSGIELAAFAGSVLAAPGTRFRLPEVRMGLVPGAGGSVSITRRVGRHRLLWWALSGEDLDVDRAIEWGLVDGRLD